MRAANQSNQQHAQAGFSMVEMLMAAFILAVGILGLTMLQTMSLKASRGSQSLTNALQIADRALDQIENEGRLSWLNITDTNLAVPGTVSGLSYVGKGTQYMGYREEVIEVEDPVDPLIKAMQVRLVPATDAPVGSKPALSGAIRYVATITEGAATAAGTGQTSTYSVQVDFADDVNKTGVVVIRTVNISRSIIHG